VSVLLATLSVVSSRLGVTGSTVCVVLSGAVLVNVGVDAMMAEACQDCGDARFAFFSLALRIGTRADVGCLPSRHVPSMGGGPVFG
jgi:hypothetical protein